MNGLRIGLTLGGALLLIYEVRARRVGEAIPLRTRKRVAILLTVLSFGAYFDFFNPNTRYPEYYHRHEFFHYYLGLEVLAGAELHAPLRVLGRRRDRARPRRRGPEARDPRSAREPDQAGVGHLRRDRPVAVQEALLDREVGGLQEGRQLVLVDGPGVLLGEHDEGPRLQPAAGLDHVREVLLQLWRGRGRLLQAALRHRHPVPHRRGAAALLGLWLARRRAGHRVLGLQRARKFLLDRRGLPQTGLVLPAGGEPGPRAKTPLLPGGFRPHLVGLAARLPDDLLRGLGDHHRLPHLPRDPRAARGPGQLRGPDGPASIATTADCWRAASSRAAR